MAIIKPPVGPLLSGERFSVIYAITGTEIQAYEKAEDITVEQTVEFPEELVPPGVIKDDILGRIESFREFSQEKFLAEISFAEELAGGEITQLLNVVFGNISIKPGIRVERIELPISMLKHLKGPRFGIHGLRKRLQVEKRPLLCTALKPQGLPAEDLAQFAYSFALGGIDIIKDDHGIADQNYSRFRKRVDLCVAAVERANRLTGSNSVYCPNITASFGEIMKRAKYAKDNGAGAMLISPGLAGLDTMRAIADNDEIALPILSHPAFQGSFVTSPESGISHYCLFGQIARLCGADASIFPNFGGRFSFSESECRDIADGCVCGMENIKEIFPAPGGGMSLERVSQMVEFYGGDSMFLIGGGLFRGSDDLAENCHKFRKLVG